TSIIGVKVNPGSKAESKGVREGDLITSINGQSTKCISNSDSHALLRTVKENLRLGLNEDQNGSTRRRSREMKSSPAASEKDVLSALVTKENTKPSRSKLRRKRKQRLRALLKEKLLGYRETPGHVLTDHPVPESDGPSSSTVGGPERLRDEEDDNSSRKLYDNVQDSEDVPGSSRGDSTEKSSLGGFTPSRENSAFILEEISANTRPPDIVESSQHANAPNTSRVDQVGEYNNQKQHKSPKTVSFVPQQVQHAQVHVWEEKTKTAKLNDGYLDETPSRADDEISPVTGIQGKKAVEVVICSPDNGVQNDGFSVDDADDVKEESKRFLPSNDLAEALSSTTDDEEHVYELVSRDIHDPLIARDEETKLRSYLGTLGLQEPSDVSIAEEVRVFPPTEIPAYFLPPKRYLDVISEENSDLSDGDRPWENSERIRQVNAIDTIPEDWFGSQDGIDTSWRDGKSLEDMSDIPVVTDSHSDSDLVVEDSKQPIITVPDDYIPDDLLSRNIMKNEIGHQRQNALSYNIVANPPSDKRLQGNVVKNVVSSFYASKKSQQPIKIETVKNSCTVEGPNSEVVEIVYLDSSDSEAISSSKSDTNLATTPIPQELSSSPSILKIETTGTVSRTVTFPTANTDVVEIVCVDSSDSEAISAKCTDILDSLLLPQETLFPAQSSSEVLGKKSPVAEQPSVSSSLSSNSSKVTQISAEVFQAIDSNEKDITTISEMISDITQSANEIISTSNEHLARLTPCTSPSVPRSRRTNVTVARINLKERCSSLPLLDEDSKIGIKSTRSVCSDTGNESDYPHFIYHEDSDASSQTTTKLLDGNVAPLKELSMGAVLRLPYGLSFLKELGFDQSEYDSYSGYMPEGSEYSFSSKHQFSERDYVLADDTENEEESISGSLPSRPVPDDYWTTSPPDSSKSEKLSEVQIPKDTKLLLSVSPNTSKTIKCSHPDEVDLLDLHQKFVERRGYHESEDKFPATKYDQYVNKKEEFNEQDFSEFRALQEYHALRQKKMREAAAQQKAENESVEGLSLVKNVVGYEGGSSGPFIDSESGNTNKTCENDILKSSMAVGDNAVSETKKDSEHAEVSAVGGSEDSEVVGNSRLLELIQREEFKGSSDELNMTTATYPYWILLDKQRSVSQCELERNDADLSERQEDSRREEGKDKNGAIDDRSRFAIHQRHVLSVDKAERDRPKSVPPSGEKFRQQMYEEYMNKLAELSQRRRLKAIKLSEPSKSASTPSITVVEDHLKGEFMDRVRERMVKLGITDDFVLVDSSLMHKPDDAKPPEEQPKKLPKHVQELMDIADDLGVWSPAQTPETERKAPEFPAAEKTGRAEEPSEEPAPPVWTPRSAGPSPTLGRKFRPVNFQSPPPQRKEYASPASSSKEPQLPKELPPETSTSVTSTSSSRLISSTSENSTLTQQTSQLRLPSSQNPTITLLQKAREGQIPKGAQYLEETPPDRPTRIAPDEVVYSVKKEYSTADEEGVHKVVELTPKKFSGIGPTTRDGIPIGLRSEVNETNQQRWYKRMYDSLHKTADRDKDFVTVRYKTRRKGQYPYTSYVGGYASEPERLAGYDSDATVSKYATLDRRKIRNKENDFTTSTLPRNRYAPSIKHAVNVYKNQPGRIEDYEPGSSSIAEIEKKQWWDEVLDIFDGELNNSSKDVYATPNRQSFTTYALKDTGYDSDSTLVFKRRENMSENLSPAEQRMAYKVVQRGGEVPLHGLRKAIPDRPKEKANEKSWTFLLSEDSEIEYFPLSPTLTRIRVHKKQAKPQEKVFYPVTPEQPLFGAYKRSARSAVVPSPPRRHSSRNNSTLRLYTKISTSKSPDSVFSDKTTGSKDTIDKEIKGTRTKSPPKKMDPSKYAVIKKKELLRKSPELKAPGEVKKAMKDSTKGGTVVKSSTTLYSTSASKKPSDDKSVKVTVAISSKGKDFLTSSSSASSKSDLRKASPLLSPPTTKKQLATKKAVSSSQASLAKSLSRPSSRASTVSTNVVPEPPKKQKKENGESKKKKDKKPEVILKNMDKMKEDEKKKSKKKVETSKKKSNLKRKDKENVPMDTDNSNSRDYASIAVPELHAKSDQFFQHLLLKDHNTVMVPSSSQSSQNVVQRTPSVSERAKKFDEGQQTLYKSEPSLRNLNVYLSHRKPVSESRFRSLDRGDCRALSPFYGTLDFFEKLDKFDKHNNIWDTSLSYRAQTPTYESIKGRSSSEPPCTSPSPTHDVSEVVSPSVSRSPSCRRIRRSASKTVESVAGLKRKVRSKSLNEADRQSQVGSTSSLSMSHATDHTDYHSYVFELLHSQPKSERFKELHKFYSSLERMAELEKTTSNTDLRPRLKGEEVIDFDRWKQLRNKERAEQELNSLYIKLMEDQKEKDLLFLPKETVRWQGDRGLRNKEKSVEDLRYKFQRLAESSDSDSRRDSLSKDVYKPLWRGNSVVNLAQSLTSVVGSKRGRPICETYEEKEEVAKVPPPKPGREIGSRLWSSLSMDQVNALKCQLSEIYNTVSNLKHERIAKIKQNIEDYEMNIAELAAQDPDPSLHVRSNSLVGPDQLYSPAVKRKQLRKKDTLKADSIGSIPGWKSPKPLTEPEKKKLSMSLCAEVKERIKKKKHGSLVIPRETLGAVAAIKGSKKMKSPCHSDASPRTCYSLMSDDSNDKRSDKNRDFLLVLTPKEQQSEVKKNMDDWGGKEYAKMVQTTSSSSSSASTVIHLGSKDDFKSSDARIHDLSQSTSEFKAEDPKSPPPCSSPNRTLFSSQSYTDLKELFGEKQATTYATQPLKQNQKPFYGSADSICKSTSPDPSKYYRAYLSVVKAGDVRKLKEKFESYDDIYNLRKESPVQKRFQSDPDLTRDFLSRKGGELSKVVVKGQELGDVQWLRSKYENPRKVSPVPFKIGDRYMPHINVISKTASLQQRSLTPPSKNEVSRTGNVDRLKRQFEHRGMSLLGQMYTSTPEITELRDIAPYLECDWIAHKNPRSPKPTRRPPRKRPASTSPVRQSILKNTDIFANQPFNPEIHRPAYRYQPEPEPDRNWHPRSWNIRPTVTFKEPIGNPIPTPPRDHASRLHRQESPHRYVESEVNIHYKSPVRSEAKMAWPEDELAEKQAEIMRRIYQEQRRTKYLNELHDMYSRRHTDNLLPSQKSPIPLNRYDDFPLEPQPPRPRDRTPEPKLVARALYNFVGQTSRELSFRRGDIIYVRRQIDKNWYEGEHNAMIGLFPFNYVEIIPYDGIRTLPKKASEGQARAKFNFQAQTHLELSLVKGELVLLTRRVDENWFEGRIGNRKGIFPVSYVEVLVEPGERTMSPSGPISTKPVVAPASHSVMLNGAKDIGQQHYQPPRPALYSSSSLPPQSKMSDISMVSQSLHIDTQSDPVPYRATWFT
ncbi:hypothetical protein GE061_016414, partial [Apolygus lucorum]